MAADQNKTTDYINGEARFDSDVDMMIKSPALNAIAKHLHKYLEQPPDKDSPEVKAEEKFFDENIA